MKLNLAAISLTMLCMSQSALGWGALGHQTLSEVGSNLAPEGNQFWSNNSKNIGMLSNVPDRYWKRPPSSTAEKTTHWFHADFYYPTPSDFPSVFHNIKKLIAKFSSAVVAENGTAPWRYEQLYQAGVDALKNRDYRAAVQMAGTMSHYIGDLSQPFHVTRNYDGADTGNNGIHAFFESKNINSRDPELLALDVSVKAQKLLNSPKFVKQFEGTLSRVVFLEIARTAETLDKVIENDHTYGRGAEGAAAQFEIAKNRMADGAATLSLLLSRMWKEAGNPKAYAEVKPSVPTWVEPDFMRGSLQESVFLPNDCN